MNGSVNVQTGEKNAIESISVNGVKIDPVNKKVDIPIPKAPEYGVASEKSNGLMSAEMAAKLAGIAEGANVVTRMSQLINDNGYITAESIPISLPANGGNANTVNNHTVESNVPPNAKFTDTTYDPVTETKDGLMSKEDKEKLNGIPPGGLKAYTGKVVVGSTQPESPFKISTATRPQFMQIYKESAGNNVEYLFNFIENGTYYYGGNAINVNFEENGVTLSWGINIANFDIYYFILC